MQDGSRDEEVDCASAGPVRGQKETDRGTQEHKAIRVNRTRLASVALASSRNLTVRRLFGLFACQCPAPLPLNCRSSNSLTSLHHCSPPLLSSLG